MNKAAGKPTQGHVIDAIKLLTEEHRKVKKLFSEFAKLAKTDASNAAKGDVVQQICSALTIHAQVEEEIFYPAVRAAIKDKDLMDEADVEHAEAKSLIAQLKGMKPTDDHYNAKVTVLGENIAHHVSEEEGEMFPKAMKTKLDIEALGEALANRMQELQAKMDEASEVKAKKTASR